jgi:hypothetical protein
LVLVQVAQVLELALAQQVPLENQSDNHRLAPHRQEVLVRGLALVLAQASVQEQELELEPRIRGQQVLGSLARALWALLQVLEQAPSVFAQLADLLIQKSPIYDDDVFDDVF